MSSEIADIRKVRSFLFEEIKDLTTAQFNKIPEGFNNNIAWNLGHIIAVQQGACYKRAHLPTFVTEEFWGRFRPGSRPEGIIGTDEINYIKELLLIALDRLEVDYNRGLFDHYTPWTSRFGTEVKDIDEALAFLLVHELLHAEAIVKMKKLVIK